jgi:uncharacterized phage protein (TIGR01671 family)
MRDIKFRAWDGRDMITPYCVRGGKACIIRQSDTNDRVLTDDEGSNYYKNWDVEQPTEFPLMQFTGLQDVNGVDIYEGDIVSHADGQVWTVEFSDNDAAFIVYNQLNSNRRLQSSFGDHYSVDEDNVMNMAAVFNIASREESPCEITGNIYQNPELLK